MSTEDIVLYDTVEAVKIKPYCNASGFTRLVYTIPFMWSSSWRKHLADIPLKVLVRFSPL